MLTMIRSLTIIILSLLLGSCFWGPKTADIVEQVKQEEIYLFNSAGTMPKLVHKGTDNFLVSPLEDLTEGLIDGKPIGEAKVYTDNDSTILTIYRTGKSYEYVFTEKGKVYHAPVQKDLADKLSNTYYPALSNFKWLLGSWLVVGDTSLAEVWEEAGPSTFLGNGYKIDCNADTSLQVMEKLKLKFGANGVQYIADVNGQNDGKDVYFTASWDKDTTSMRFEAPLHDFPQVIEYTLLHKDTLGVRVGLLADGGSGYYMRMCKIAPKDRTDCLKDL